MTDEPRENTSTSTVSPFESIQQVDEDGTEFWSARDLANILGYTNWRNFVKVVAKAEEACENSHHAPSDHFVEADTLIVAGKGAKRRVDDWHLSRYACYLIVQNADPEKPIVAIGQTYFAVQTRRAELAGQTDAQVRIYTRQELSNVNKRLATTATTAAVVTAQDFAIFQDHGYRGLYNGETAKDIAARKGLRKGQAILDWMSTEELAANLFRATQTEAKIRREGITSKEEANRTHHDVGVAVRRFIIEDLGGTPPEQLPAPDESIQQLQARERRRIASERQPALFPEESEE